MKRVLIVVSAFKPAMLADMQRARMLAWELRTLDWEVEILSPRATEVRQDIVEPDAEGFFPADLAIHMVGSFARPIWTLLGSRTSAWRTILPMYVKGRRLLQTGRFDLIYFSTATFLYFVLGQCWKKKYGVPYIVDFHDPWVTNGSGTYTLDNYRSRLLRLLSICMERRAVVNAAGLVAVSPRYVEILRRRYAAFNPAWIAPDRHAVIPFGALDSDLAQAAKTIKITNKCSSAKFVICYVGAGGAIMARSFALVCRAMEFLRSQDNVLANRVCFRLFGTTYNWKPDDVKFLEMIAQENGAGDLVTESPERVSYRRSLELLLNSDGVLVLGVDDAGYMPSKLFSYALSGKPLLASLHRDGPAFAQFQITPGLGHALWFDDTSEMAVAGAAAEMNTFLQEVAARRCFDRRTILKPFLAQVMARRHVELFEACL